MVASVARSILSTSTGAVLARWKSDFSRLFQNDDRDAVNFDHDIHSEIKRKVEEYEREYKGRYQRTLDIEIGV